jgi:large subunit ribosomal protein L30e
MLKAIEKAIKESASTGENKFKCGHKEILQSMKGLGFIVFSKSVNATIRRRLDQEAAVAGVQIHQFEGNSVELGKLCGMPFRVSVVGLKGASPITSTPDSSKL